MIVRATLRDVEGSGSVVGRLSAVGTAGALTGTFLTGYVLLGIVPVRALIAATGVVLVVAGVLVTVRLRRRDPARGPRRWWWPRSGSGRWRSASGRRASGRAPTTASRCARPTATRRSGRSCSTTCSTPGSTSTTRPRSTSPTPAGSRRRRPTSARTPDAAVRRAPRRGRRVHLAALPAGPRALEPARGARARPRHPRDRPRGARPRPRPADRRPAGRRATDDRRHRRREPRTSSSATRSPAAPCPGTWRRPSSSTRWSGSCGRAAGTCSTSSTARGSRSPGPRRRRCARGSTTSRWSPGRRRSRAGRRQRRARGIRRADRSSTRIRGAVERVNARGERPGRAGRARRVPRRRPRAHRRLRPDGPAARWLTRRPARPRSGRTRNATCGLGRFPGRRRARRCAGGSPRGMAAGPARPAPPPAAPAGTSRGLAPP